MNRPSGFTGLRNRSYFLAVAVVMTLDGCSARFIQEDHDREVTELSIVYVDALAEPPHYDDLTNHFGNPETYEVEDLRLHAYALNFDQLRTLHAATRKAAELTRKAAEEEEKSPRAEQAPADSTAAAVAVLTAPFWVPLALLSLPIVGADYAAGSAIVTAGDDRAARLAGRKALFAYGRDEAYRWHACCLPPDGGSTDNLALGALPNTTTPYVIKDRALPQSYRVDNLVIRCHRAKSGNRFAQFDLSNDFRRYGADPVSAYYWARVLEDNPDSANPQSIERLKADLPKETIKAAEAHYESNPLALVNCRMTAEQLIAAFDAGSGEAKIRH